MSKMRMYFYILGTKPYYKEVSSVEEAKTMIDAIADFVNAKVEEGVFPDHCSTAGLEEYDKEEKEWVTWYDENGLGFDEHFSAESEEMTNKEKFIEVFGEEPQRQYATKSWWDQEYVPPESEEE